MRYGDERLPPCRLCFDGAPPEVVERCRIERDADGVEDVPLDRFEADTGVVEKTDVAFALIERETDGLIR